MQKTSVSRRTVPGDKERGVTVAEQQVKRYDAL